AAFWPIQAELRTISILPDDRHCRIGIRCFARHRATCSLGARSADYGGAGCTPDQRVFEVPECRRSHALPAFGAAFICGDVSRQSGHSAPTFTDHSAALLGNDLENRIFPSTSV